MFLLEQLSRFAREDKVAIRYGSEELTFAELDRQSDAFAAWLLETYGPDRSPVVLCGHKEMAMPVCMFGALKAGRAYVPVDVTFPEDRVARILEQVQPKLVVSLSGAAAGAPAVLDGAALRDILSRPGRATPDTWIRADEVAYGAVYLRLNRQPQGRSDHCRQHRRLLPGRRALVSPGGRRCVPE